MWLLCQRGRKKKQRDTVGPRRERGEGERVRKDKDGAVKLTQTGLRQRRESVKHSEPFGRERKKRGWRKGKLPASC